MKAAKVFRSAKVTKKDANGGKLGQFTTEVATTIKKAREESAVFFMEKIRQIEEIHALELKEARESDNAKVFMQGFVTAALPLLFLIGVLLSV